MGRSKQLAYLFEDKGADTVTARGGKGFGLSELARLDLPVPPGFTITTSVARAFAQHGCVPNRLSSQLRREMKKLEQATGKQFGSPDAPLLVSVRSGAAVSMPGMMDTILNLGLNDDIVDGLASRHGSRFAQDCRQRFLSMFAEVAKGRVPEDPWVQLELAVRAVIESWNTPRAVAYRNASGISSTLGTAVNIQAMVYGNLDDNSGAGVVFSRNVSTGENHLSGEFLVKAQGEDIVDGSRTPLPIEEMKAWNQAAYNELEEIAKRLEAHQNDVVDIEFTVESGKLHLLQVRKAKRTPEAAATIATHFVWEKRWSKAEALTRVSPAQLKALNEAGFSNDVLEQAEEDGKVIASGLAASAGVAVGRVVVTSQAAVAAAKRGEKVILARPETSPDDLSGMLAAAAIITKTGGATSHAAVVARSLGKPAVVGCRVLNVREGDMVSVDGRAGLIVAGELTKTGVLDKKEVNLFLRWVEAANTNDLPKLRFEMLSGRTAASQLLNDFYLADALEKACASSALESEAVKLKADIHKDVADKLAIYLVAAVITEAGHCFSEINSRKLRPECRTELEILRNEYDCHRRRSMQKLKEMPHEKHVRFLHLLARVFEAKAWGTVGVGGIGGKKWAIIARAAEGYLKGKVNATVFADHAFDLEHNGGSVFGKHPMILRNTTRKMNAQLEAKKVTSSVSGLYRRLTELDTQVSPEVTALFRKGVELGLWFQLT